MTSRPVLIGVDWGTSSFRAYLIGQDGCVIDSIKADEGILSVRDGNFESVFERLLVEWLTTHSTVPIVLSGMITSRNGWVELDYLPLPTALTAFASALTPFTTQAGRRLYFVTGLAALCPEMAPDVMRGEETELIGQLCYHGGDGLFLLPGTHSKWVWIEGSRIMEFQTFMTGEVYAVLKEYSILGRLLSLGVEREEAFERGVIWHKEHPGSILHTLFSVRTLPLFERIPREDVADFLSGLLIAEEISGALRTRRDLLQVIVIGRGDLAKRYCHALGLMGVQATDVEQGMVARGHFELARQKGLIQ